MRRPQIHGRFYFVQAASLLCLGLATLGWSHDLMLCLIHAVGEVRALGPNNVVRRDGGLLLTNPAAIVAWTLPFWGAGLLLIGSAVLRGRRGLLKSESVRLRRT